MWKMHFDGASSKDSDGAGVVFISPSQGVTTLSFNLEFETKNNISEYEALVLGLRAAMDMKIEGLSIFGCAKMIVHQVINIYQIKHPRLKEYRNEFRDLIDIFFSVFNISFVPKEAIALVDSLAIFANNFKIPLPPKPKYNVEVKYRPVIPDNVKN